MNEQKICGQCKKEIPVHAPFGICPVCVLDLAKEEGQAQNTDSHPSSGKVVPEPHQLTGKFPNLEIVSLLGQGGMGAVYLARQTSLDRIVALKILSRSLAEDPSFTERFAREAKTLAKLTHPNIVTVFDSGQAGDASYLVMEYVDGVNLRDAIAAHEIDASRALAIVQQICDALQHAHDSGVIHRDVKPENILIDRNGHVKIADFGLAKLLQPQPEQYSLTGTRQVLGTRNYMAPEQIENPESVDHRADLYSLGVVLYELLTGELPIGRFAPPSDKSGCSKRLDDLVMRTLAKDPGLRFQQASMIGSAVRELESSIEPATPRTPLVDAVTRTDHLSSLSGRSQTPVTDPIPFTIPKLKSETPYAKAGSMVMYLSKANGLVHLYDDRIELEYRVSDPIKSRESDLRIQKVPLKDLASVQIEPTLWGGARLRFRAMSLSAVDAIPKAKQGAFYIDVNHRDREAAEDFVDATNRMVVSRNPNRSSAIRRKVREPSASLEEIVLVDERLKVPRIGFYFCAVLNLLFGIGLTILTLISMENEALRLWLIGGSPIAEQLIFVAGPFIVVSSIIPLIAARSIQHHRNLHLLIVLLLAMVTPYFSPLLISIPLSIWSLVVLCMPTTRRVFRNALMLDRFAKKEGKKSRPPVNWIAVGVATPLLLVGLLSPWIISASNTTVAANRPHAVGRTIPDVAMEVRPTLVVDSTGAQIHSAETAVDFQGLNSPGATATTDSFSVVAEAAPQLRSHLSFMGLSLIAFISIAAMFLVGLLGFLTFKLVKPKTTIKKNA